MTALIEAVGVERMYGEKTPYPVHALRGVDLSIAEGETVAILGPSGSGKSTLLHLLGALDVPTAGDVLVGGVEIGRLSDRERSLFRLTQCGFVFQAFHLVPSMTVSENIALAAMIGGLRRRQWKDRVDELLEMLGLTGVGSRLPQELSGGQRQRVAVARAVFRKPPVVFADEPTGNLDSASGAGVLAALRSGIRGIEGGCLVMVTHDVDVASTADRAVLINDGRAAGEWKFANTGNASSAGRGGQLRAWMASLDS
ncbi:ABC transporter ATP-binding protein [Sinomonas sp. JGH33]|uniref:ABC transporter ATP-binding protein n=1 Tax=Sinomonas terricola TaxID=3110330 RepID=A0ABU5T3G7_9MICC|nr:ABC transporter ATP-binding protein [Sinomonas sp. JGH33]MEA5454077.1 ABC transporter ATP-binding protein [Sinomonas sp. JGH33]